MCEDCGNEQTEADMKYHLYKIGLVLEVEEMKAPLKKCRVKVDPDGDDDEGL